MKALLWGGPLDGATVDVAQNPDKSYDTWLRLPDPATPKAVVVYAVTAKMKGPNRVYCLVKHTEGC